MDRKERLAALGLQRLRVLDCLDGENVRSAAYFAPAPNKDVFAAYRDHMLELSERWREDKSPLLVSLLAAGRLLSGEIQAARAIIDNLPPQPFKLDHGAGYGLVAPVYTLETALPLPAHLSNTNEWTAGSQMQEALREWLTQHASELRWLEAEGVYATPDR